MDPLRVRSYSENPRQRLFAAISNCVIFAPSLIWYKLSSICLNKIGKQLDKKANFLRAFRLAKRFPIEMASDDHLQIINLAEEKKLPSMTPAICGPLNNSAPSL
jgi:hypothetical protein